jgi:hypothetical protein
MKNIGESVNSMWTYFQNNLDNSIKNNIPHKTAKNKDGYPWINGDLTRLIVVSGFHVSACCIYFCLLYSLISYFSYNFGLSYHKRSDSNTIPPLKADGILHPDSKDKGNIQNKLFQMAFSTKTKLSDESFKNTCNMKGKFETKFVLNVALIFGVWM